MFVIGANTLLEIDVIVKLLGLLDGFLFYGRLAGFLVILPASKVPNLPERACLAEIDDELGWIAFYLRDACRVRRGANCLPSHTGFMALLLTPRMATSGALMMGAK